MLPHTFYADRHTAADLMGVLLSDERIDYKDQYLLTSILSEVDRDSAPKVPRYWGIHDELNDQFEFDKTIRSQLQNTIGSRGFYRQPGEGWTFTDTDL